jgi:NAD(P)-dependent dehydrogenase (short-subunit alcohol dehydrogenase family)
VGRSIALGCARAGASVVLVGHDAERGADAVRAIRGATGNQEVVWLGADMGDFPSVRRLAAQFRERCSSLHVLSLNAAALTWRRAVTPAGHERIFATNYLGQFLLVNLLLDLLRASAPARVIAVSGVPGSIRGVRLDWGNLMLETGFSPLRATGRAALAKVLFTFELARRLEGSGVTANTFHPGLVRSGLPAHLPWLLRIPASILVLLLPRQSRTGIYLATSPAVEGVSGRFFVGRKPVPFAPGFDMAEAGRRLWSESGRLTGSA